MSFPVSHNPQVLLRPSRKTTLLPLKCSEKTYLLNKKEETQKWNGLKIFRGKKLLKDLSTWGIGGPCNYFVEAFDQTQLLSAIRYCHEHSIRYIIIGRGSNCLFDDMGFEGCVILNRINFLERKEPGIYRAGSGFRFNSLGMQCSNEGFTGLEFAGGIPGTVGGATYMNAGANGQETADAIDSVDIVTVEGELRTLDRNDLKFGYRSSSFQDMEDLAAIVAVTFRLKELGSATRKQQEYLESRRMTQPLGDQTAGSVFRNPSDIGVAAAELIEKAGLKGFRLGGAMVSKIHANFFINVSSSTSRDMLNLIDLVKDKIDQKFGVRLKEEVVYYQPYCNHLNPSGDKVTCDETFNANKMK
ncbi:hypothetical protein Pint_18772 [Pistacia integerrima]|uniref:Uncharacterized protein n=1 Tax=Pistacia integerrima TaxID=434235 RepID=A0ACC0YU23_9ROSI|nr:hypothetical protein Pint_18772 [Pistacia integerrima]